MIGVHIFRSLKHPLKSLLVYNNHLLSVRSSMLFVYQVAEKFKNQL